MASPSTTSSVRLVGALLHRATRGISTTTTTTTSSSSNASVALRRVGFIREKLRVPEKSEVGFIVGARRIWTSTPLCMGRRACKIADRKGAQNAKKMKRNSKIGKEIVSAIKKGGPNPASNTILAAVLEKAKELDVPRDIVDRNLKKALDKGQEAYIEKVYEL